MNFCLLDKWFFFARMSSVLWTGFDHTVSGLLLQIGKNQNVRTLRIGKNVNTVKTR